MWNEETTPGILIVDDKPSNLKILRAYLSPAGYSILEAVSGLEALEKAELGPDLILLDVLMPDMDGLETCRRLKENDRTREIPVIFLSALQDSKTRVAGLSLGAVDYISKPFDGAELKARVKTQIALRQQERQLNRYAKQLEQMVEERTRQLIHADRLATIGTLSAAVLHEISNPLTFIGGNIEFLSAFWRVAKPIMEEQFQNSGQDAHHLARLSKVEGYLQGIQQGSQRIRQIMESLRVYTRRDDPMMETCLLVQPIQESLKLLNHRLKRDIQVEVDIDPSIRISCNPQKISQVFVNLISNAVDAMQGGPGKITIESCTENGAVVIHVKDSGPGIPIDTASSIFDPFFTTKSREEGTGLGLFISRKILEEHEGGLSLASPAGTGAEFIISLPRMPGVPAGLFNAPNPAGDGRVEAEAIVGSHVNKEHCMNTPGSRGSVPDRHETCLKA